MSRRILKESVVFGDRLEDINVINVEKTVSRKGIPYLKFKVEKNRAKVEALKEKTITAFNDGYIHWVDTYVFVVPAEKVIRHKVYDDGELFQILTNNSVHHVYLPKWYKK